MPSLLLLDLELDAASDGRERATIGTLTWGWDAGVVSDSDQPDVQAARPWRRRTSGYVSAARRLS